MNSIFLNLLFAKYIPITLQNVKKSNTFQYLLFYKQSILEQGLTQKLNFECCFCITPAICLIWDLKSTNFQPILAEAPDKIRIEPKKYKIPTLHRKSIQLSKAEDRISFRRL